MVDSETQDKAAPVSVGNLENMIGKAKRKSFGHTDPEAKSAGVQIVKNHSGYANEVKEIAERQRTEAEREVNHRTQTIKTTRKTTVYISEHTEYQLAMLRANLVGTSVTPTYGNVIMWALNKLEKMEKKQIAEEMKKLMSRKD